MHTFYHPEITQEQYILSPEESAHCCGSLRHRAGDQIRIVDGMGHLFEATITEASAKKCAFDQVIKLATQELTTRIHLVIAPTKNMDRMEWMVEKLCEMGIAEISFVQCKHSERKVLKTDRLEKKAIAALKQSKNLFKTVIHPLTSFSTFIKQKPADTLGYIAVVEDGLPHLFDHIPSSTDTVQLLIGPEGDFFTEEISKAEQAGFRKVSLGDSVLRTETAGLLGCHTAALKMRAD